MSSRRPKPGRRMVLLCAAVLLALAAYSALENTPQEHGTVEQTWTQRQSGSMVEVSGRVLRLLADDLQGSRHQRFILELADRHTLLVSHNIDLAPRVPLTAGDSIRIRGQFEWNQRGGVLHWTHSDPRGQRPGGWIKWEGREYR